MSRSTNPNHLRLHQAHRGIGVGSAGFTFFLFGVGAGRNWVPHATIWTWDCSNSTCVSI